MDPGINYEGQVGVHKSMSIITKGKGVHKGIHYVIKRTKGGVHMPPMPPPPGSAPEVFQFQFGGRARRNAWYTL